MHGTDVVVVVEVLVVEVVVVVVVVVEVDEVLEVLVEVDVDVLDEVVPGQQSVLHSSSLCSTCPSLQMHCGPPFFAC